MAPIKIQSQGYTQIRKWVRRLDELSIVSLHFDFVFELGFELGARVSAVDSCVICSVKDAGDFCFTSGHLKGCPLEVPGELIRLDVQVIQSVCNA